MLGPGTKEGSTSTGATVFDGDVVHDGREIPRQTSRASLCQGDNLVEYRPLELTYVHPTAQRQYKYSAIQHTPRKLSMGGAGLVMTREIGRVKPFKIAEEPCVHHQKRQSASNVQDEGKSSPFIRMR